MSTQIHFLLLLSQYSCCQELNASYIDEKAIFVKGWNGFCYLKFKSEPFKAEK